MKIEEVYIEECKNSLEKIEISLQELGRNPSNKEAVEAIQAACHQLEGNSLQAEQYMATYLVHKIKSLINEFPGKNAIEKSLALDYASDFIHSLKLCIDDFLKEKKYDISPELIEKLNKYAKESHTKKEEYTSKYLDAYVSEAEELLQKLNDSLIKLEKTPSDIEAINQLFRYIHTVKGSSAVMGFQKISDLAHSMENVLVRLRNGELKANEIIINTLFKCFDALGQMTNAASKKKEITYDTKPLLDVLEKIGGMMLKEAEELSGVELAESPETIKPVTSVKVDIKKLDRMMDLVGELSLNNLQLQTLTAKYILEDLDEAVSRVSRLSEDLQYEIMQSRMISVEQIFNRFPRMVRDLAVREGKNINFIIEGSELELDRTVLDELAEPLIHLLKNAVGHGIELPEDRKKAGKSAQGNIKLIARRERNFAVIEIMDDGRGFDPEEIKRIAVEKGLIRKEEVTYTPLKKLMQLAFTPGFTTSKKAGEVSGRGVGMNVVKTKIERLNGSVELESEKGGGTRIRLQFPLTLAIMPSMIVAVGDERYALPLLNILRIVKLNQENIKTIGAYETFILNKEDIALVRLANLFGIPLEEKDMIVVIVERFGEKVGLAVNNIISRQDILIKPLEHSLQTAKGFAGTTILGDGRAALVLDLGTLDYKKKLFKEEVLINEADKFT